MKMGGFVRVYDPGKSPSINSKEFRLQEMLLDKLEEKLEQRLYNQESNDDDQEQ